MQMLSRPNTSDKKYKRMRFGLIEGQENLKQFIEDFEQQFDCKFEQVRLVDELFKKNEESLNIYNNGIRVISYPDQNQPYEIEQILLKEFGNFFEYSYNLIKSLDDPSPLLLGLDYVSTSKIQIQTGQRVFLPHFGLNVLVYEYRAADKMSESGTSGYVAEFNYYYEQQSGQISTIDSQREKIIELEKLIQNQFKNTITKFAEININVKDKRGFDDVKRLRPLLE
ncbi:hypothetical protein TTHERM_00657539 (macronuclear) [Tetrahymena thermophila SB210]|uniref:Uncharacterized protein n=1 Tax=Tetrahymena thermophila (strain SB210) TaxID=312017 RepID=A4VCZ7_TETTS|nr:hypothetical protein TTHERM_00657539 [Tetrahymena thermophila SB210]EDK31401.1 hypothetical protein TTHERM_00657539 [Tetrahymena thermophila SB210]|eukprot:XP_001471007.1 hypothetical protein TTHERM_00657539 [Tetrahymena thermophila SB210]